MEEEIVGLRFRPTGYEVVNHHLKRKLQKINESRCVIPDVNIYDYNPQDLCAVYNERSCKRSTSSDSFFFCPRNRLNPNSHRNKRQARGGYWKETGKKKDIEEEETGRTIGTKRILVFHCGKRTAIALCHIKKKARNRKGNSKKQQIKKGNSKKRQSKKAGTCTPSYETNSISPSIEAQETNFQQFSLLMEELNIPTQPEKGSLEPLLMAEQSVTVNHGFDDEHGYTCNLTYEQRNSIMQMENFGSKEASPESSSLGQPAVESPIPQTKSPIFEGPEYTAGGTCYKESYTLFSNDYEDGISISDLDFWRDDELVQKQIHDVLY
ncbi:NAC domain-containing protein 71-like [Punica granatum]|uniref:NAC domain-containing protein n=2 Tax=Punica granatum TaxID=22663 RepID=A0A218VW89_PUNGR|nr:NAC domain-containing protein 71-like [Punica granatum]OWM64745.1 hypothetical protein CDL15_Pgr028462 [Punica granatum]PKI47689.1 hypothetical protein CRG98_031908 [Punica granatum]